MANNNNYFEWGLATLERRLDKGINDETNKRFVDFVAHFLRIGDIQME